MSVKIQANFDKAIKDFSDLARHIRVNAEFGLDKALQTSLVQLKSDLKVMVNDAIKIQQQVPSNEDPINPALNIPKSKNDLIKHIFGEDISKSDYLRKSVGNKTINDNSNVFVVKDKRLKIWQSVSDSDTLDGQRATIRNRLINGIFIDEANGRILKFNPEDIKGIKLDCSRDTGTTIDSEKKFEAYKNSDKMSRSKENAPFQRLAAWTVRQEDVSLMMNKAVSIDSILERIMDGDYDTAANLLRTINKGGEFNEAEQKIADLKDKKDLTQDVAVYLDIMTLVKNLAIDKIRTKNETRYVLVSNYGDQAEKSELFFDELRKQIYMWITGNEDFWFNSMVEAAVKALKAYDSKAKFV